MLMICGYDTESLPKPQLPELKALSQPTEDDRIQKAKLLSCWNILPAKRRGTTSAAPPSRESRRTSPGAPLPRPARRAPSAEARCKQNVQTSRQNKFRFSNYLLCKSEAMRPNPGCRPRAAPAAGDVAAGAGAGPKSEAIGS